MPDALHLLSAQQQWDAIRHGETTSTELVRHHLGRIAELDPRLGAFARVDADRALAAAGRIDAAGQGAAPLSGVPIAEKELAARAGTVPAWTRLLPDPAPHSDAVIEAIDASGAVSLGATTAPEFGLTGFTEPVGRDPVRNPWDAARSAGGSSGGAAAAVAAGLVPFAVGSDGGGSIRIPAASCGVVGLKPSRGRVPAQGGAGSLAGMVTAGPIARTVADAAMLLDALAGPSPDSTGPAGEGPFLGAAVRGEGRFQVGVLTDSVWDEGADIRVDAASHAAVETAIGALDDLGHGVEQVSLPGRDYPEILRVLWTAGAAAIPAHGEARLGLLEPYTRALVERGRRVPAETLIRTLSAAAAFERRTVATFRPFDAVLTPALALVPPPLGWYADPDPDVVFLRQVQASPFTSFVNVAGLPALVLPVATVDGLPFGVQLIGRPGGEATLLALARQLERRLGGTPRPPSFR